MKAFAETLPVKKGTIDGVTRTNDGWYKGYNNFVINSLYATAVT